MKDLLAFLFKVKKEVVSAQNTVDNLKPVLEAVAIAKSVSVDELFASALCDFLVECKDDIDAGAVMANVRVGKHTSADLKSGSLDKVNDDCLALALTFLDFRSRCKVESLCHRLFQLSRAVLIQCERFDKVWNKDMDTLKVARRFRTKVLVFDYHSKWSYNFVTQPMAVPLTALFRDCVEELRIGEQMIDVTFPNLKILGVHNSVANVRQVLGKHPSVEQLNFFDDESDWRRDAKDFFECLSLCKRLRKVDLCICDAPNDIPIPEVDLSHIEELILDSGHMSFFPLFAPTLQSLTFDYGYLSYANFRGPKPKALRCLKLVEEDPDYGVEDLKKLAYFSECQLQRVHATGALEVLSQLCCHFSTEHLLFDVNDILGDFGNDNKEMDNCLQCLGALLGSQRLQSFTLLIPAPADWFLNATDIKALRAFFGLLSQLLGLVKVAITVQIPKKLWAEITKEMSAVCVAALNEGLAIENLK